MDVDQLLRSAYFWLAFDGPQRLFNRHTDTTILVIPTNSNQKITHANLSKTQHHTWTCCGRACCYDCLRIELTLPSFLRDRWVIVVRTRILAFTGSQGAKLRLRLPEALTHIGVRTAVGIHTLPIMSKRRHVLWYTIANIGCMLAYNEHSRFDINILDGLILSHNKTRVASIALPSTSTTLYHLLTVATAIWQHVAKPIEQQFSSP